MPEVKPEEPRRGRRRNPMNELLDDLNRVIHDPNARPETVEKALSRKTDVIFRQADDKLADVQRENADLRTQNAALLSELAPEGAEGARAKAEKYDKLKPEFDALKQTNEQHEKIL